MMRGMGQVTCEFPVGTLMAFSTGLNHITPVQAGFAVIGRQDVMGSMTIGTLGSLLTTGEH